MDIKKARPEDLELVVWAEEVMIAECDALEIEHVREWNVRMAWQPARYMYLKDANGQYVRDRWGNVKRKQTNVDVRRIGSSGVYRGWIKQISLKLGTEREDARYTILHELAHHIDEQTRRTPSGAKPGHKEVDWHDERFWEICFQLCEKYECNMQKVYAWAKGYKRRAATNAIAARTPQPDEEVR